MVYPYYFGQENAIIQKANSHAQTKKDLIKIYLNKLLKFIFVEYK